MLSVVVTRLSWLSAIDAAPNQRGRIMTFELVKAGWPNTVAILALVAMPMVALLHPTQSAPRPSVVETADLPSSALLVANWDIEQ
jgi:hypothetical protein